MTYRLTVKIEAPGTSPVEGGGMAYAKGFRMNIRNLVALVFIFSIFSLTACNATEISIASANSVPLDRPWDISLPNNTLQTDINIPIHATYELAIGFNVIDPEDYALHSHDQFKQIEAFIGRAPDILYDPKTQKYIHFNSSNDEYTRLREGALIWKRTKPGVVVPIYYKVETHSKDGTSKIIEERSIETEGMDGVIPHGRWARRVAFVGLKPGKYRVTIKTFNKQNLPPNIKTYIELYQQPNSLPIKEEK